MDLQDADLVVGVFWKRFGTPTHDTQSGTEHELRRAFAAWQEHGRPSVFAYFCTRRFAPKTALELTQWQEIAKFREALPEEQLWWSYRAVRDFERMAREHLTAYLLRRPEPKQIFLCHSAADKAAVRALYHRLVSDGFLPWFDEEDLLPGATWELAIRNAVRASDFVVVCLSKTSTKGVGYVHKEIKLALDAADTRPEGEIFVIPARLESCDVPERLQHLHWVDLFSDSGYPRLTEALGRDRRQTA